MVKVVSLANGGFRYPAPSPVFRGHRAIISRYTLHSVGNNGRVQDVGRRQKNHLFHQHKKNHFNLCQQYCLFIDKKCSEHVIIQTLSSRRTIVKCLLKLCWSVLTLISSQLSVITAKIASESAPIETTKVIFFSLLCLSSI